MIEGIEEYLAKLTSMAEIEDEMFQSVDQCGEFVRDDARLRVPVDTGDLRKSIDHTTRKENGEIVSEIHTNSDHAVYVEFGTGPVGAANHDGTSPEVSVMYSQENGKVSFQDWSRIRIKEYVILLDSRHSHICILAIRDNEDQIMIN